MTATATRPAPTTAADTTNPKSTQTTEAGNPVGTDRAGSLIVAAVEQAWSSIQHRHLDVPGVVVTFGAGTIGTAPGSVRLGHFAPARWAADATATETPVHELFIGGEGLARGPVNLLGTLLHEAAHALAHARDIQDTSRQGRYHNTRYKTVAEELGIHVAQVGAIGWSDTTVPEATINAYSHEVDELGHAIRAYRRAEGGRLLTPGTPGGQRRRRPGRRGRERRQEATQRRRPHLRVRHPSPHPARTLRRRRRTHHLRPVRQGLPRPRHRRRRQRRRRGLTRTCHPRTSTPPPRPTRTGPPTHTQH